MTLLGVTPVFAQVNIAVGQDAVDDTDGYVFDIIKPRHIGALSVVQALGGGVIYLNGDVLRGAGMGGNTGAYGRIAGGNRGNRGGYGNTSGWNGGAGGYDNANGWNGGAGGYGNTGGWNGGYGGNQGGWYGTNQGGWQGYGR